MTHPAGRAARRPARVRPLSHRVRPTYPGPRRWADQRRQPRRDALGTGRRRGRHAGRRRPRSVSSSGARVVGSTRANTSAPHCPLSRTSAPHAGPRGHETSSGRRARPPAGGTPAPRRSHAPRTTRRRAGAAGPGQPRRSCPAVPAPSGDRLPPAQRVHQARRFLARRTRSARPALSRPHDLGRPARTGNGDDPRIVALGFSRTSVAGRVRREPTSPW